MKHFSHLSKMKIREIITSHHAGEPKLTIAKRLGVDNSTVHYHIRKYERSYPGQENVYALVKEDFQKACIHPSLKCLLCGRYKDIIKREDRVLIRQLEAQLSDARFRLRQAGLAVE